VATKAFEDYFAGKSVLPGDQIIAGDEVLVLRSGTVFKAQPAPDFAFSEMEGNAVETAIVTQNVFVPIEGILVVNLLSTTFTFAANDFTYIGPNRLHVAHLFAGMSVAKVGGGDDRYEIGIFVNGLQVGQGMLAGCSTSVVAYIQCSSYYTLQTNDVINFHIRNLDSTSNAVVQSAQVGVE